MLNRSGRATRRARSLAPAPGPARRTARGAPLAGLLRTAALLAFVASAVPSAAAPGAAAAQEPGSHDWPRFGYDAARSNASPAPAGIAAADLGSLRRQQVRIDGTVDASPIYLHAVRVHGALRDVFFVTTTYGRTLAIDADDGTILWRFVPPGYDDWAGSYRITNATPVADPDRRSVYAAAPDGAIRKLAVADGRVVWTTAITRLPEREKIAASLNYFRGRIVATTGGYIGDRPPYQGHVAVLDAVSGRLLHGFNALCSDRSGLLDPSTCRESGAAIWGRAGAVIDTTDGHIFVATGDGHWDGRNDWGDAVLELDADATRLLGDYTPQNTESLDARDVDLGSTAPVLPGGGVVGQGGKDAVFRILDWSRFRRGAPHRGGEAQIVPTPSRDRLFTAPAVLHTASATWIFLADNGGTAAWELGGGRLQQRWSNHEAGTSPILAGGLLYVYDPRGGLRVYDPVSGRRLAVLECGDGHWNSPIVVDGRIALPEGNANRHRKEGVLDIWRRAR